MSLAVCVNANAEWWKEYIKADELLGQEECYANVYSGYIGRFICWSNNTDIRIKCYDGIFDDSRFAIVGFYKDGKMIDKEEYVSVDSYAGDYDIAYISGRSHDYRFTYPEPDYMSIGYKIIHHLKYVGNVRIIVPKWRGADLDITIPMNPNLITYIPKEKPQEIPEPIVEEVSETSKEEKIDTLTIAELWKSLDTLEVFKRPTADEIWEDFKNASIAKQDTVETTTVSDSIITPKTDEIWESYENAVRYIKYNDAAYLEATYFRIENLLYVNKREMRKLPKDSNELQLKKQQIKIMKAKMEEIDRKYFELTNKYIYQG